MRRQHGIFDGIDWVMVFLYLTLVLLGWVNIYAAVYNEEHQSILDITQRYGKQLIWIALSVFVALVIMLIDGKFYSTFSVPIYVVNKICQPSDQKVCSFPRFAWECEPDALRPPYSPVLEFTTKYPAKSLLA